MGAEGVLRAWRAQPALSPEVADALCAVGGQPQQLRAWSARAVANAALATAAPNGGVPADTRASVLVGVAEAVCEGGVEWLADFGGAELADLCLGFSLTCFLDAAALRILGGHLADRAWQLEADDLATALRAFGELRASHGEFLEAAGMELAWKADQLSAQGLVQAAEALALLSAGPSTPALAAIAARTLDSVADMRPPDLAAVAWALAHLGFECPSLADAIARRLFGHQQQNGAPCPEDFARLVWALPRLGGTHLGPLRPLYGAAPNGPLPPAPHPDVGLALPGRSSPVRG